MEQEFKERFLKELLEAKELEREKVRLREEKIQHERGIRYHAIVEVGGAGRSFLGGPLHKCVHGIVPRSCVARMGRVADQQCTPAVCLNSF